MWEGEIKSGYFYTEDLRGVRAQLLAEGHQPKVSMRGLCEWSALRLRVPGGMDCVIRELCEDAQVLQQWTERLGVPYRGQRLAGASLDVFLHLLQGKREDTRSRREELLARQQGMCKLCGAPITLGIRDRSRHPGGPVLLRTAARAAGPVLGVSSSQDEPGGQP